MKRRTVLGLPLFVTSWAAILHAAAPGPFTLVQNGKCLAAIIRGSSSAASSPFFCRVGCAASWASGTDRCGNFGRNVFHGPGINSWDFTVFKNFKIYENHRMFSHAQFNNPSGSISSTAFGRITSARDPRVIQFTLKYMF